MTIMQLYNAPFHQLLNWNELFLPDQGLYEVKFTKSRIPIVERDKPIPAGYYIAREHSAVQKINILVKSILSAVNNETYIQIYDDWYKVESDVLETVK